MMTPLPPTLTLNTSGSSPSSNRTRTPSTLSSSDQNHGSSGVEFQSMMDSISDIENETSVYVSDGAFIEQLLLSQQHKGLGRASPLNYQRQKRKTSTPKSSSSSTTTSGNHDKKSKGLTSTSSFKDKVFSTIKKGLEQVNAVATTGNTSNNNNSNSSGSGSGSNSNSGSSSTTSSSGKNSSDHHSSSSTMNNDNQVSISINDTYQLMVVFDFHLFATGDESIEIHFAMYSLNEARFISESIVISSDSGKNRISLFRDITGSNLLKDELYLVGRAFRKYELGHQNSNSAGSSSTNSSKNLSIHSSNNNNNNNNNTDDLDIDTLRRPLAVCAIPFDTESIKELANGHSVTKYCEFYEKTHEKKFTMLHAVIAAQHSGRKLNAKPTYLLEQDDHHAPSCSSNTSSTTTNTTNNMSSSNSSLLSASNNLENSNDIIDFATLLSGNQKDTSLASLSRKGSMVGTHSPNSMTSLSSTALESSSGTIGSGSGSNLLSSHSSNHSLVSAASSHDSTLVQSAPTSLYTYTSIGSECKALKDQLNVNLVFYKGDYDVIMKEVPQFQRLFTAKPINWFSINTKNEAKTNYSFLENRCDIYPCLDRATLSSSILKSKNPLIVMRLFEVKNPQTKEGKFIPIYRTNAGGSSMNHSTTKRSNSGLIHTAGGSSHHLLTPIQSSSNFGSSSNLTASPGENGSSSSPNSYPLGSSFTQQQQDNNNNMHMNGPFYYSSYVFCKKTNPKYFEPFHIDASHVENFDHLYLYLYVYNVNTTNKSKYELEEQPVLIGYYKFTDQDSLMNFEKMKLIELYKTKSLSHTSSSTSNSNSNTSTTTTTSGNSNTTTSTTTTGNTNHSDHHPYSSDSMKTLNRTNTIVTSRTNVLAVLPDLKMSKPEKNNIKMSIIFFISSIPHSHLLQILFLWKQFILKNVSMMELLEQVKKKITYKECVLHAHNLFKSLFSILEFYDEHEEIRNKTLETLFYFIGQYFSKTEQLFEQIVSKIPISEKVYQSILKHLNDRFQESITSLESILKEFNSRSSTEIERSSVGNSTIPDTHYKSLYHAIQSFSLVMILLKKRHFSQEKKKITSSYQKEKQLKEIQEFKEQFHSLVAKLLAIFNLDGKNVPNIAIIKGNLMKSLTVSVFDILHDMLPQSHFSNFLKSFFESTMSITLTEKFNVYSNILKCKCFIHSSGSSSSGGSSGNSSTLNQQQFDHFDGNGSNSSSGSNESNNESMSRTGSSGGILSLSVIHSSAISHVLQQNTRYEIVDVIILKILFPMIRESLKSCLDGTMNQNNNTTTTTTTNMNNTTTTTSISSSNNTQQTLKHYLTLLTQIGRLFEMTLLNLLSENNEEVSIPTQLIMLFEQLCQFGPTLYQLDMSLANESKKYLKEMSNVNSDSSSKSKISLDQLYTNNMELRKKIYSLYYVIIYWCSTLQNFELFNQTMNYLKKNSKDSTSVFTSILLNMINCTLNGGEFGDKSCYPCVNPLVSEIEMFRPFHKKRVKDIFGFLQYLQKQEKEASKNVFVDGNLLIESLCLASFSSILESETRITIFRNMTEYYSTREQVSKFNNTPITPLNVQKFIETLFLIFSSNTSLKQNNSIITTPTTTTTTAKNSLFMEWSEFVCRKLFVENSLSKVKNTIPNFEEFFTKLFENCMNLELVKTHFITPLSNFGSSGQTSHQADIQLVIKIFNQLELKRKNQKLGEAQSPQKKAKKNVLADRYEILKKIGKGGFGSVFKVCDLNSEDKKILAMKILPKEEGNNAEFIQMSKLNHKHILPVYEIFETKLGNYDKWCFTMPFLELGDFQSYLLNLKSNLPIKRILNFMDQMLSCIEYIHGREVYHRDIKPENFLLRTEDEVVLSDFGLSKGDVETVVTKTSIVGTELFQSPELFAGDVKDVSKTDIYGLGCVFYIMITRDFQTTVRISIMSNGGKEIREKLTQTLCGNNNHENNKTTNSNNGNTSSNNNSSNNTSSNNNSSSGSGSSGSNTTRQDHASLNIQALIDFVMIMLDKDYEKRPSASVARQVWLEQKIGYKTTTIGQ